jgi:hypothetical protein
VNEQWECKAELMAVEGSRGFADHDSVEPSLRICQSIKQGGGLRPSYPRQGAAQSYVKELDDNLAVVGFDERLGARELPLFGTCGVL